MRREIEPVKATPTEFTTADLSFWRRTLKTPSSVDQEKMIGKKSEEEEKQTRI